MNIALPNLDIPIKTQLGNRCQTYGLSWLISYLYKQKTGLTVDIDEMEMFTRAKAYLRQSTEYDAILEDDLFKTYQEIYIPGTHVKIGKVRKWARIRSLVIALLMAKKPVYAVLQGQFGYKLDEQGIGYMDWTYNPKQPVGRHATVISSWDGHYLWGANWDVKNPRVKVSDVNCLDRLYTCSIIIDNEDPVQT